MTDQVTSPAGESPPPPAAAPASPPAGEAPPAGESPPPPPPPPAPGEATAPGDAGGSPSPSSGDEPPAIPEWRKTLAGEDEKLLKSLEPYTDGPAVIKALNDSKTALRTSREGYLKMPGEDASDEDRAAFNTALGVPETADKYERVEAPEGLKVSEQDTAFIDTAIAGLHEKGGMLASPEVVGAFQGLYHQALTEQAAQLAANAAQAQAATKQELETLWQGELETNLAMANNAVGYFFGDFAEDDPKNPMQWQLEDGTKLGDHAVFIRAMAQVARSSSEDLTFVETMRDDNSISPEKVREEIGKIYGLRDTGKKEDSERYNTLAAPGGRLEQLLAIRNRLDGKAA